MFRPIPGEVPKTTKHDELCLNSKCVCPPCQSRPEKLRSDIQIDPELDYLRRKPSPAFVIFMNELYSQSAKAVPNFPVLDTIVFNGDGSMKYTISVQANRLRMYKSSTALKTFIFERKYHWDLEYQKKKYQRQNLGFSFIQLDHTSQKLIKQFQNNIKYTNPILNRIAILKSRGSNRQEILTAQEMTSLFGKIQRKLFDFKQIEYLQVFPVMYGEEQHSYTKTVKYFRNRECNKKIYKTAEYYVGNWITKNETIEELEQTFITELRSNEEDYLMYLTYKLFIFFQQVSQKQVDEALLFYVTNDMGSSFYLKNIEAIHVTCLVEVEERIQEKPKKLEEMPGSPIILTSEMKGVFNQFQKNFSRLEAERVDMEEKQRKDIEFSNEVYESLGYQIHPRKKEQSFINSIWVNPEDNSDQFFK